MKYLSLFTGIGGFELGIEQAYEFNNTKVARLEDGQKTSSVQDIQPDPTSTNGRHVPTCIGYSEIDKYACQIYQRHYPNHKNYGDITKINADELPDFDLLVGGFPCQAFSVAGKRAGFNDTRGTLFFNIARICKEKRPQHLVLENVKGLLSHDSGKTFQTILGVLADLGYFVEWQVLNSKYFGVPQNRERVFIVGHLGGEPRRKVFPIYGTNRQNRLSSDAIAWSKSHRTGKSPEDYKRKNRGKTEMRINKNGILNTLSTGDGCGNQSTSNFIDKYKIRRLTPLECERLQGFPDSWTEGVSATQRYKCLGNAVTVSVIREIVKRFLTTRP